MESQTVGNSVPPVEIVKNIRSFEENWSLLGESFLGKPITIDPKHFKGSTTADGQTRVAHALPVSTDWSEYMILTPDGRSCLMKVDDEARNPILNDDIGLFIRGLFLRDGGREHIVDTLVKKYRNNLSMPWIGIIADTDIDPESLEKLKAAREKMYQCAQEEFERKRSAIDSNKDGLNNVLSRLSDLLPGSGGDTIDDL